MNFGSLKTQLNLLNSAANTERMIVYYQLILAAHDRKGFENIIKDVPDGFKEQAFWLKNFCKTPRDILYDEIRDFSPETQVVALVILFSEQRWRNILDLYKYRDSVASDILKAFDFHYALTLLISEKKIRHMKYYLLCLKSIRSHVLNYIVFALN